MKALILAAGLGSRLQHKTSDLPKALVSLLGKPILEYQLRALLDNNVNDIVVVVGKDGGKIIDFVRNHYPNLKVEFVWNHEYSTSNSSYSFWLAKEWIRGEVYVHLNCDILFSAAMLKKIVASSHSNIIAVRKDITLSDKMENVVLDGGKIVRMSLVHKPDCVGKAYGLAKFSPNSTEFLIKRIESYLAEGDKNQWCFGIIHEAADRIRYYALDATNDLLLEINTLDDLEHAERILKKTKQV